jgi:nucleotide-binding universal stress UspA family protein
MKLEVAVVSLARHGGGDLKLQEDVEQAITRHEKEHPAVAVLGQVAQGGARAALLAAAHDAQLLVVGSRGRGGIKGNVARLGQPGRAASRALPCRRRAPTLTASAGAAGAADLSGA